MTLIMGSVFAVYGLTTLLKVIAPFFVLAVLGYVSLSNKRARLINAVGMTLGEWILSHIPVDTTPRRQFHLPKHSHHYSHYSKRFYRYRHCHKNHCRSVQACNKTLGSSPRPVFHKAFTSVDFSFDPESTENEGPTQVNFDSDSFPIGIDNHASRVMSNKKKHFVTPITPLSNQHIRGVNGLLQVKGKGIVEWTIEDDKGRKHAIRLEALYVPDLAICLLSPQCWCQQANDHFPIREGTIGMDTSSAYILMWGQRRYKRTIPYSKGSNVAIMQSAVGTKQYRVFAAIYDAASTLRECVAFSNVVSDDDDTETESDDDTTRDPEQEPILFRPARTHDGPTHEHVQIDEENFNTLPEARTTNVVHNEDEDTIAADNSQAEMLRWHYRLGHASFKLIKLLSILKVIPTSFDNTKTPKCAGCLYGSMTKRPWRTKPRKGQQKSEIYPVTRPGQVVSVDQFESSTPGFLPQLKGRLTRMRYKVATVFVDHYSRLSYIHLQRSFSSNETQEAKQAFEAFARRCNVRIEHYHADNGRFADNAFINDVQSKGQTISYCAVNAHFQNGIAEKFIRDISDSSRKSLLHAKARWPEAIAIHLWPSAVKDANYKRNVLPNFPDGSSPLERFTGVHVAPKIKDLHPFGCPVYRHLTEKHLKRWDRRAMLGIHLGPSDRHASSVSLVLNPQTGLASPQFHVIHDDFFETVRKSAGNPKTFSQWQRLAGFTGHTPTSKLLPKNEGGRRGSTRQNTSLSTTPSTIPTTSPDSFELPEETQEQAEEESEAIVQGQQQPSPYLTITRSGRRVRPSQRMREAMQSEDVVAFSAYYDAQHEQELQLQDEMEHPLAFMASSNADTMYYDQAIRQPDAPEFVKAIIKEVNDHIEKKHWKLIPREEVPSDAKVLPSVWSMKRKRDIQTQQVYKHKARLNLHGGKQEFGLHYYETYAPVVTWFAIRLLLIIAILLKWYTRQIDFILAYPQADITEDIYMDLPKGIETKHGNGRTHVLKLLKNLYGAKDAGRNWNQHLTKGLVNLGFVQSAIDECVFYRGNLIFIVYVDDGIFFSPDDSAINKAIKDLSEAGFDVDDQGDVSDYVGVHIDQLGDGSFKLTQPHLIKQVIEDVSTDERSVTKDTPALSTKVITRNKDAPPFDNNRFNYRSVIGKLNFLAKSTRPDIEFATHQCARFCSDPKQEHGDAIIRIIRYLKGTMDKGIFLRPKTDACLEVYADADFCGNWNINTATDDPATSRSRTGFAILFAGCPVCWSSRLQGLCTLSSTEAEYVSLSTSLRHAIPLMELLREIREHGYPIGTQAPRVFIKAYEDNAGALEMARLPKMRPRTRHINQVYHHFRDWVRRREILLYPVDTLEQMADILTKPLAPKQFTYLREKLLGW